MAHTRGPTTVLDGRYALEETLGRSATGMVWRATDTLLRRTVTVKLVHPRLADDPSFTHALAEQTRRVAAIGDARLARLLDSGEQDRVVYVVREHVDGASMRSRLDAEGPLSPDEATRIGGAVLEGLAAAHDAGVLHLALDPDDVIVADDGAVRVTDLGVGAAIAAARPAEAADLLGEDRLAPEQTVGGPVDARTDVYSAGVLVFEMLTGELPRGRTSPRALSGGVPRGVDRAVRRALDPDPERRFADAPSFARALRPDGDPGDVQLGDGSGRGGGGLLPWLGIPLLVAGVAAGAIGLGLWAGTLEVGGPLGVRPAREEPAPPPATPRAELPVSATAIDPFGDDDELSTNASLAVDGDPATAWRSEDYFDGTLGKPGVGLVLDLGRERRALGLRLWTAHPGFTFRVAVGNDPEALLDVLGDPMISSPVTRVPLQARGRYVLIWITSVVETADGDRAEVAEARVVVPDAGGIDA